MSIQKRGIIDLRWIAYYLLGHFLHRFPFLNFLQHFFFISIWIIGNPKKSPPNEEAIMEIFG